MRLNKYLAHCGVGSRRACDALIFEGRVTVNGESMESPAYDVSSADLVRLDGETVRLKKTFTYIKMNKARGYVSTVKDPHNEKTVMDLLPKVLSVVPVGRLDKDTTGILLFTDDGDLLHRLIHPRFEVEKEYEAILEAPPHGEPEQDILQGITLENGEVASGRMESLNAKRTHFRIWLKEGKKREIKRIFRAYNTKVKRLHRNSFAGLSADELAEGKWKKLTSNEIRMLQKLAGMTDTE